ncbi:MAG: Asp-tRNA(Asn)/Glu-tRNA(Gln) amidotransferase subunit GatA [Anaerolineales bacterium]|nr:Asp-tRNA(Asn)/Glu-tRNA(Gln) amidotransferase subunit GatA [Anaerolineales bacterium]
MTRLTDLTLLEAAAGLRAGQFSARELAQAHLDRIALLDEHLHAYLALTPELALSQADQADSHLAQARRQGSGDLPPLIGLPMAVKDVLCLAGVPTTCGSRILEGFRPPYTATAVQRLLDQGVVVLGKANTDEFAMGSSTENSAYGVTHNPWSLERVPGGSSGGPAAAVAAGLCLAALATDTGGSIRQPASFCGITGLKPSYGRVSRYGLIAYGSSLDCIGGLARSAADLLPIYQGMAGFDPLDSTSRQDVLTPIPLEGDLRGVRIGVPREYFIEGIHPDVEGGVRQAVETLVALGAQAVPISLPHTDLALPVYYVIAPAEASANLARYDGIRFGPRLPGQELLDQYLETRGRLFGPEVKRRIMLGTYALSAGYYDAYYGQAQKVRTLIKQDFDLAFQQVDLIGCPVAPTTAFAIGAHGDDPLAMYLEDVFTLPANLAGVPGMAFPVGRDADGLPIGMQLMAPALGEAALFQATHAYQQATGWHKERPPL